MLIPTLNGNYIDLVILLVLGLYIAEGIERGFWALFGELASFLGSFALGLRFYSVASKFLIDNFSLPYSFSNALGFILVVLVAQVILGAVVDRFLSRLPSKWWDMWWSKALGILPATLSGLILVSALLVLLVSIPISSRIKSDITASRIGGYLVRTVSIFERDLSRIFGGALKDTLTFFTIRPESRERINIPYKPARFRIDETSENRMLVLVNEERKKQGLAPLILDPAIRVVARAHSQDMWERGYFSHVNPDGKDAADRMSRAGVEFTLAGENLALAPTVDLAHQGLMDSPGHRRNILEPGFSRVGIGVIDGGVYGKMFTQVFTN